MPFFLLFVASSSIVSASHPVFLTALRYDLPPLYIYIFFERPAQDGAKLILIYQEKITILQPKEAIIKKREKETIPTC